MNSQIKSIAAIIAVMMLVLMGTTTWIQFARAPELNASSLNKRTLIREYGRDRGPIVVDGHPVAESTPIKDQYKFQRAYSSPELYAAATGYYSVIYGATAIEKAENPVLNGTSDSLLLRRVQDLFTGSQPQGGSVLLTLNAKAQKAAAKGLGDSKGAVVALDPRTGAILAMYSSPSYDPNTLATHDSAKAVKAYQELNQDKDRPLDNRAIGSYEYPPGSTFKLVTAAAALESGTYQPDTEIAAPRDLKLPGTSHTLHNSGDSSCSASGKMTLADALKISCNTGFAQLGMDLGADTLRAQAEKFGFNSSFTMPLNVSASVFPSTLNEPQLAMAAIGQDNVRATPMQMAMVGAAIANGGTEMTPYLVDSVRDSDLRIVSQTKPSTYRTPISAETASELTAMMVSVVNGGTGTAARISGVKVAGKTGTAETGQGEAPDAWFVGFAPADNPQVVVAVAVEDGGWAGKDGYGGTVAAPIARQVMQAVLGS